MSVSVVICTLNRKEFMTYTLGQLRRQLRSQDQVVLVDDGSDPDDAAFFRRYALPCERTLIRHDRNQGRFVSKNEGILACRHECVVQLDNDAWLVDDRAFEVFEAVLAEFPRAGAIALPVHYHCHEAPSECGSLARRWNLRDREIECSYFGCGCVLRKSAVVKAGLYPLHLQYGPEEDVLALRLFRLGYEVRACASVRVIHGHEVLSGEKRYQATRDTSPGVDVAGSQLCLAAESLAKPWAWVYGAWILAKAAKNGLPIRRVLEDYQLKRPHLDVGRFRLSAFQSLEWMVLRSRVRLRMAFRYLRVRRTVRVK